MPVATPTAPARESVDLWREPAASATPRHGGLVEALLPRAAFAWFAIAAFGLAMVATRLLAGLVGRPSTGGIVVPLVATSVCLFAAVSMIVADNQTRADA